MDQVKFVEDSLFRLQMQFDIHHKDRLYILWYLFNELYLTGFWASYSGFCENVVEDNTGSYILFEASYFYCCTKSDVLLFIISQIWKI